MTEAQHGALQLRVKRIEPVTPEINRYTFCAADGSWLPPFSGGSHITVLIPSDGDTKRNAYSLMSSPYDTSEYQIAVRRVNNGKRGSLAMHDNVREGDVLLAGIPANLFPVSKHARHHLFLAGGVGVTPVYAQLDELSLKGSPFELHLAVRGPGHAALGRELKERYGDRVTLYGHDGRSRLNASDILTGRPLGTHAYVCGPRRMVDDIIGAAHDLGWSDSNIHFERFDDLGSTGDPFSVTLARSGAVIEVSPEQSLLEAVEEAGHKLPYLCRGGACGDCETEVLELEGTIDHRDDWLSESDRCTNKLIMPCVSRATCTKLVINA
ncbi:ferredoxin-NADP reductase [Arthrobacter sp. V4I6]|uniref:PDR/VanB family oxidoreductase n=1 Tax=unclassified Arthrobacter TaxID=235627 RepID=UPI00277F7633|nr:MULTISPECIES: PDR/VanB family oxidoreductase [unclassified Arthrobacter]MDQ0822076.1 ferredoxin-NADP reductase [Arthrobacter sp. V1I7]MDQ0856344.1 ferredoxin-NADP reductase [Arthrobacter sp. V4I6]